MNKKIILIGYMGSGKSKIAELLAKKNNIPVFELDDLIEKRTNLTISELFKSKGEIYFRKIENEIYKEILNSHENFILSTGGGTPCYYDNYNSLKDFNSFYLKASIETLMNRLKNEKSKRPLISDFDDEELAEFIGKHLFERNFFYNHAKYKISVDDKSEEEIVNEITKLI